MSGRLKKIIAVLSLLVALIVTWSFFSNDEPTYNGYKLSKLVVLCDRHSGSTPAEQKMASRAISDLGTNVIPFLIKWMQEGPTTVSLYRKLASFEVLHTRTYVFAMRAYRMEGSIRAFSALGTNGDYAVPQLNRLMLQTNSRGSDRAAFALGYMQRESAVQALVTVLTNASVPDSLKETSAYALQFSGTNAATAVAALIECLENKNPELAREAASTLGELQLYPDLVVPALLKLTQRSDLSKAYALYALGEFGAQATNATATVLLALKDPDPGVRDYATNALKSIAPALLTNDLPR